MVNGHVIWDATPWWRHILNRLYRRGLWHTWGTLSRRRFVGVA